MPKTKKKFHEWVQGWLAPSGTWALTHQSAWRKTSGFSWKYENCILNDDILQGMPHAARQLVTAGVRMLPRFPRVGDGADYGTFGPQTDGRIPLDQWIMAQGPSALVAQRTGEVHGLFRGKGQRVSFWGFSVSISKWYRYRIVSPAPQLKITLSWQCSPSINLFLHVFAVLHKAAVNSVKMELTESLFGSAWIWQSFRPPKFPVPFSLFSRFKI